MRSGIHLTPCSRLHIDSFREMLLGVFDGVVMILGTMLLLGLLGFVGRKLSQGLSGLHVGNAQFDQIAKPACSILTVGPLAVTGTAGDLLCLSRLKQ